MGRELLHYTLDLTEEKLLSLVVDMNSIVVLVLVVRGRRFFGKVVVRANLFDHTFEGHHILRTGAFFDLLPAILTSLLLGKWCATIV
jgi:hypothetical protein